MMQQILELLVFAIFAFFAVWLYSRILNASPYGNSKKKRIFAQKMRVNGAALLLYAVIIGSFYRFHVLSLTWAVILYIPVIIAFFIGMRKMQPYLRPDKEEAHNDRTYFRSEHDADDERK